MWFVDRIADAEADVVEIVVEPPAAVWVYGLGVSLVSVLVDGAPVLGVVDAAASESVADVVDLEVVDVDLKVVDVDAASDIAVAGHVDVEDDVQDPDVFHVLDVEFVVDWIPQTERHSSANVHKESLED